MVDFKQVTTSSFGNIKTVLSADGTWAASAHDSTSGSRVRLFKWNAATQEYDHWQDLPVARVTDIAISGDGTHLAIGRNQSPYLQIYRNVSDVWTALTDPTQPTSSVGKIAWGGTSDYLAVSYGSNLRLYLRSTATSFTAGTAVTMVTGATSLAIGMQTSNGQYVVAGHGSGATFMSTFRRSGTNLTALGAATVMPSSTVQGIAFDPTDYDRYFIVGNFTGRAKAYRFPFSTNPPVEEATFSIDVSLGSSAAQSVAAAGNLLVMVSSAASGAYVFERGVGNLTYIRDTDAIQAGELPSTSTSVAMSTDGNLLSINQVNAVGRFYKQVQVNPAEGAFLLPAMTFAGEAEMFISTDSDLMLPAMGFDGLMAVDASLEGELILPTMTAEGYAFQTVEGVGAVTLPSMNFAGEVGIFEPVIDPGIPIYVQPARLNMYPANPVLIPYEGPPFGGGDLVLPAMSFAGELETVMGIGGDLTLPAMQFEGAVGFPTSVNGDLILPAMGFAGEGDVDDREAEGALVLPAMTFSGELTRMMYAQATWTLPAMAFSGEVDVEDREVEGDLTLPAMSFDALVIFDPKINGELTLPAMQFTGTVWQDIEGSASLTLPALGVDGEVWQDIEGAGVLGMPAMQFDGEVWQSIEGSTTLTLPAMQFDGDINSDHPQYDPVGEFVLPSMAFSGELNVPIGIASALVLPKFQVTGTATISNGVSASLTLPKMGFSGLVFREIEATGESNFPPMSFDGEVWQDVAILSGPGPLPKMRFAGELGYPITVDANLTFPKMTFLGDVRMVRYLEGDIVLPAMSAEGYGFQAVEINGALVMPTMTFSGELGEGNLSGESISIGVESSADMFSLSSPIVFGFGWKFP